MEKKDLHIKAIFKNGEAVGLDVNAYESDVLRVTIMLVAGLEKEAREDIINFLNEHGEIEDKEKFVAEYMREFENHHNIDIKKDIDTLKKIGSLIDEIVDEIENEKN